MFRRTALLLLAACVLPACASSPEAVDAARRAAAQWLRHVDASDVAASWEQAASGFKRAVTRNQWAQALASVRTPLGKAEQRSEQSAQFKTALPGAPDGNYVLLQFQTVFEKKAAAIETVTVVLDADKVWRVTGYFIK